MGNDGRTQVECVVYLYMYLHLPCFYYHNAYVYSKYYQTSLGQRPVNIEGIIHITCQMKYKYHSHLPQASVWKIWNRGPAFHMVVKERFHLFTYLSLSVQWLLVNN